MKEQEHKTKSYGRLLAMLLSLFLAVGVYAQKIEVTGVVVDQNGEPMIGVSVLDEKTSMGTITDFDGKFRLDVAKGNTLKLTYIGYKEQLVKVTSGTVKVVMTEDSEQLEEVVVVGYGTQKKGSVTGSITSVDAKTIEELPSANLATALAGRLSGVQISSASGIPGAESTFNIRAKGTINDSSPLYVIDGVVRDKEAFDALDVSEVSNISVLKDGASAAVYGSRAANGVVLVTTKKGSEAKPRINYTGSIGIDSPTREVETLSAYEQARYLNDYRSTLAVVKNDPVDPSTLSTWYPEDELEYLKDHEFSYLDEAWRTPYTTRHSLNISGGTEKVRYFMGGAYFYSSGSFDNLTFERYNFRTSLDVDLNKNLTVGMNLSTTNSTNVSPAGLGENNEISSLYSGLLTRSKITPGIIDGKYTMHNGQESNPLALISKEHGGDTRRRMNYNVNVYANYKVPFVEGLNLKLQYNRNVYNTRLKRVMIPVTVYKYKAMGTNGHLIDPSNEIIGTAIQQASDDYIMKRSALYQNYQLNMYLTYQRKFGKHDVGGLFVYEQSENDGDSFDAQRKYLISSTMPEFFATSSDPNNSIVSNGNIFEGARISYVGRLNYSYDDKYLVETSFRVDGSTKFAPDNRWGFFPSVALGWRMSSEPFFADNVKFIDYMKLRASVATLGNDAVGGWDWMPKYNLTTGAVFGGQTNGVVPGTIANEALTWEKSTSYNVGFDSRWFKGKLELNAEYFFRHTYDILDTRYVSVPTTFGASLPKENYGVIDSQGFEIELGWNGKVGKNFSYFLRGNFGYATSKWVKRDEPYNMRPYKSEIGKNIDRRWGYECVGIIRTQEDLDALFKKNPNYTVLGQKPVLGMLMFKDIRSDIDDTPDNKITDSDQIVVSDRITPPISYGFTIGGKWKGFTLDVFFQGLAGFDGLVQERRSLVKDWASTYKWRNDHWSPTTPDAKYPSGQDNKNAQVSTFWTYNASFLRCKNINLSYDLPAKVSQKLNADKIRLFLSGSNLFLLEDHLKWADPEMEKQASYPIMKNYSFGVNVTF